MVKGRFDDEVTAKLFACKYRRLAIRCAPVLASADGAHALLYDTVEMTLTRGLRLARPRRRVRETSQLIGAQDRSARRAGLLGRHAERDAPASALLALVRRSSPAAADVRGRALTRAPVASGGGETVPAGGAHLASPSAGTSWHQPSVPGTTTHSARIGAPYSAGAEPPADQTKLLEPEAIIGGLAGPHRHQCPPRPRAPFPTPPPPGHLNRPSPARRTPAGGAGTARPARASRRAQEGNQIYILAEGGEVIERRIRTSPESDANMSGPPAAATSSGDLGIATLSPILRHWPPRSPIPATSAFPET